MFTIKYSNITCYNVYFMYYIITCCNVYFQVLQYNLLQCIFLSITILHIAMFTFSYCNITCCNVYFYLAVNMLFLNSEIYQQNNPSQTSDNSFLFFTLEYIFRYHNITFCNVYFYIFQYFLLQVSFQVFHVAMFSFRYYNIISCNVYCMLQCLLLVITIIHVPMFTILQQYMFHFFL